jgi:hypothetical protein
MTAAWAHYVNSNNLLNELRGLTRNYPFSSELLDEAKVSLTGPNSQRHHRLSHATAPGDERSCKRPQLELLLARTLEDRSRVREQRGLLAYVTRY